jgi:hypothetical protein
MKIYLSGAITGITDYMERFQAAEEKLIQDGHTVFNPAAINSMMPAGTIYEEYMRVSFTLLEYVRCYLHDARLARQQGRKSRIWVCACKGHKNFGGIV